jgi:hypothetical protein
MIDLRGVKGFVLKFAACMAVVGELLKLGDELGIRGLRSAGAERGGFCVTVLLLG